MIFGFRYPTGLVSFRPSWLIPRNDSLPLLEESDEDDDGSSEESSSEEGSDEESDFDDTRYSS